MSKSETKTAADRPVGRESDKFMLRFPDGMRDRIAEEAKKNNRSMNAEIVARLESSFDENVPKESVEPLMFQMNEVVAESKELKQHIGKVLDLMKGADTYDEFIKRVDAEFPASPVTSSASPAVEPEVDFVKLWTEFMDQKWKSDRRASAQRVSRITKIPRKRLRGHKPVK